MGYTIGGSMEVLNEVERVTKRFSYIPTKQQEKFHDCRGPAIYIGGVGAGKTTALLADCFLYQCTDEMIRVASRFIKESDGRALFAFKRYNLLLDLWHKAIKLFSGAYPESKSDCNSMTITIPFGYVLEFAPILSEQDTLNHLGMVYSALYVDGADSFTEDEYCRLWSRVRSDDRFLVPRTRLAANSIPKWWRSGYGEIVSYEHIQNNPVNIPAVD